MYALRSRGEYPINHLVVVKDELLAEHADLRAGYFDAFAAAKQLYIDRLAGGRHREADRVRRAVSPRHGDRGDPLPYGVEPNRAAIETLIGHAVTQGTSPGGTGRRSVREEHARADGMTRLNPVIRASRPASPRSRRFRRQIQENAIALGTTRYDAVVFEMEHNPLDPLALRDSMQYLLRPREPQRGQPLHAAVAPMVRIPPNGAEKAQFHAKQALDLGVYGIVRPRVSTVEEAYNAVAACRYPRLKDRPPYEPAGIRGDGPTAAVRWSSRQDYYERANMSQLNPAGEILVMIEIEDARIEQLPEILRAVRGSARCCSARRPREARVPAPVNARSCSSGWRAPSRRAPSKACLSAIRTSTAATLRACSTKGIALNAGAGAQLCRARGRAAFRRAGVTHVHCNSRRDPTRYEVGARAATLDVPPGGFDARQKWRTQGVYAKIKLLDHLPKHYTCIMFDRREARTVRGARRASSHVEITRRKAGASSTISKIERAHMMGGCMGVAGLAIRQWLPLNKSQMV